MSSYAKAETFVIWDMEDCKIPNDLDINSVCQNIKSALANEGYRGKVSIKAFYSNKNQLGDDDLLPHGVEFVYEREIARRDIEISLEISCFPRNFLNLRRDQPRNLLLIAENKGYVYALEECMNKKYYDTNILLADNVKPSSVKLTQIASSIWLWKSLSSGGTPIDLSASASESLEISPSLPSYQKNEVISVPSANKRIKISVSIPNDIILEVFSRLPAKSVLRFHRVSKLWASILGRPYFTELFLTRSSAQPRLLFALQEDGVWSFFSIPQHQKSSSSLVVATEFHMKFPPENMWIYTNRSREFSCGYVAGLIYFYAMWKENEKDEKYNYEVPVICNPITGQFATLPYLRRYRQCYSFFGFDPIDKQFKVLFMAYPSGPDYDKILTFGKGEIRWRRIKCSLQHEITRELGICINGVLYYLGDRKDWVNGVVDDNYVIVCFDVRSERFKFIFLEDDCDKLINYKGKLGVIFYDHWADDAIELRLWVLEDVKKKEWSKYAYTLRYDRTFSRCKASVVGVTATGEIVISMENYTSEEPFYVYYFHPERNIVRRVEIQGFGKYHQAFRNHHVYTFADHVEDLNLNDSKLLNSLYASYVNTEEEELSEDEDEDEDEESEGEEEE